MWSYRLSPFSHTPGVSCLIPETTDLVTIFPTKIVIGNLEIPLNIKGPVKNFTVFQNMEKGCIEVFGSALNGYFRYKISDQILFEKMPEKKEAILLPVKIERTRTKEKLFLGINKSQDWDLIVRRSDLREILPFWFYLGSYLPRVEDHFEGTASLFKDCISLIEEKKREDIESCFLKIFKASFSNLLIPRLFDDQYQGIIDLKPSKAASPLVILKKGAQLIRSLFFYQKGTLFSLLPALTVSFHTGKFINIDCNGLGLLDMDWSKKQLKTLLFKSKQNSALQFNFPKPIKTFRLRLSKREKGRRLSIDEIISIKRDQIYFIDRFEK